MINRQVVSLLLALAILTGSVVGDVRDARANPVFLPLIIGVLFNGLMGVGAAIEMYDGAPTAAGAVGAKALSVTIGNPADNGAAEGAVRVPTTAYPASASAIPAPSAPATATVGQTWALSGSSPACPNYASGGTGVCTYAGICNQSTGKCTQDQETWCPTGSTCLKDGVSTPGPFFISRVTNSNIQGYLGYWCGDGYTGSGGSCTLYNARAAVNDGKQDLTRTGQALAKIADDKKGAVNAVLSQSYVSNDTADVSGISVSGEPRLVRTVAKSDGGSDVIQMTQKTDGSGATYLEKRTYSISANGDVTSASQTAVTGSLVANTNSGLGYSVSGGTAAYTPAAPGSAGGAGGGSGSSFPSDYARSGEAAAAAQTIANKLDEKFGSGADPTDPTLPADSQFDQAFFQGTFSNLLGWQLPAHTSECPSPSFSWNGNTYAMTSHCQLVNDHFSALQAAMTVVWSIIALFIVLRA